MNKCCLCIPLRPAAFLIALWFFVIPGFEGITGLLGRNAILSYVSQTNKIVFFAEEALIFLTALGGLFGIIGSCLASRRFILSFSIISWIICIVSSIQRASSLIIIGVNRQYLINECASTGDLEASPANVTPLYTPIFRNGSQLTPDATIVQTDGSPNYATCAKEVEIFLIVAAVVIIILQFIQFYFASVVSAYASKLSSQPRHGKLRMMQQEWDEQQMPMRDTRF